VLIKAGNSSISALHSHKAKEMIIHLYVLKATFSPSNI